MKVFWSIVLTGAAFVMFLFLTVDPGIAPGAGPVKVNTRAGGLDGYPCSQCHTHIEVQAPKSPPRHPHEDVVIEHMPNGTQCYMCHAQTDMDGLQLISGEVVSLNESEKLCGQCHGEKKRDWDIGAHGKIVGSWQKDRFKYTCADCHNPHKPAITETKVYPPPPEPKFLIRKGEGH